MDAKVEYILKELDILFPDAECELVHKNNFELICAVALSAQTTDESVNRVTPALFAKYPTAFDLANADLKDVEKIISTLGLYRNKSKNLIAMAKELCEFHNGEVPNNRKALEALAGVGRKTANVVLSVGFDVPALAVDTHVARISKRLGLAKYEDDVLTIEKKLMRKIDRKLWNHTHHSFIFFGRYLCKAQRPECERCPFTAICKKDKEKHK